MAQPSSDTPPDPVEVLDRLARDGLVQLPTRRLEEFLAARGRQAGPVSDAGTRAVQQQRGERV
jgi:hypothetical protein